MAKITTVTNPLTGQPAQVDQLDHTAQQIDDGLNIARGVSNPNLLDNWYLGNPINQRGGYVALPGIQYFDKWGEPSTGVTDKYYTATHAPGGYDDQYQITVNGAVKYVPISSCVRGYTGAGYGIDRWMNESDAVVATLENGLLKLTFSGATTYMQKVQVPVGIQLTCSVLVENIDGDLYLLWQDIDSYTDTHDFKLSKGMNTITINTTKQNYRFCIYNNTESNKTISLKAVKLELGSQQTLAHQENGNWVLNEIPDYGEQLRMCQMDFERIWAKGANQTIATGIGASSNIYAHIKIAPKRANPSAQALSNCLGYLKCGTSALDITPTDISLISFSPDTGHATLQLSGSFQAGVAYRVGLLSGGCLDFDCNL